MAIRVLLDENLPRRLRRLFRRGVVAKTVTRRGWSGIKNGILLKLAESEFDVFVTMDRGLGFRQDLDRYDLAVVLLSARSNQLEDLEPLMPRVNELLDSLEPGSSIQVGEWSG